MFKVEYEQRGNKPKLWVFNRNKDGTKTSKIINNFKPYFYAKAEEGEEFEKNVISLFGDRVKKIYCELPSDVPKIKKNYLKTFEADVPFIRRFLIDNFDEIEKVPLKVCYLDIETNTDSDFPDLDLANHEITAIACFDNFKRVGQVFTFIRGHDFEIKTVNYEFEIKGKKVVLETNIFIYSNEVEMLRTFLDYINKTDPDIITGWNVVEFDMRYLINRMKHFKKFGVHYEKLSPIQKVSVRKRVDDKTKREYTDIKVQGRIIFDMLEGYEKLTFSQMPFYNLDYVSEKELMTNKIHHEKTWGKMWKEDFETFIKYNMKDTYLVYEIDKKKNVIDYFDEVRRLAHCDFNDVFSNMRVVDSFMLYFCKGKFVLPGRTNIEKTEKFKGAKVLDPIKGLHNNVGVMDFASMYPNLIISCNMSPETLVDIPYPGCVNIGNGVYFSKEKQGIFPEILSWIFAKRIEWQKIRDKFEKKSNDYTIWEMKQYAIKLVMNSFYGVLGNPYFRFFRPEIAKSITKLGRECVLKTQRVAEENGYKVVYGDTDSVFMSLKGITLEEVLEHGRKVQKLLNDSYDSWLDNFNVRLKTMKVEFEKLYGKLILMQDTKKRYAGIISWYKGKVVEPPELSIKGLEYVRADSSLIAKQVQGIVLEMILKGNTKKEVDKYLFGIQQKIKDNKLSFIELGISTPLKRVVDNYKVNTPTVRAVKYSNKYLKSNIEVGQRFYLLYVKSIIGKPTTDVIAFKNEWDIPKGTQINIEKHIEETTGGKIERLYNAVGWGKFGLAEQLGLNNFL